MDSEAVWAGAFELARGIREGRLGCSEVTDAYIARIEMFDEAIGALAVRDFERGRMAARAADEALARGENWGPLHGVPVTVKESFNVEGLPTTWGLTSLAGQRATKDAAVVARLKAAGAHVLGKTNVPVMLGDLQTTNPVYGTTRNPWDLGRTPGGSSGGAAAALAAGFTALELGSDLGGSIRNPAHFCGIYGHKPTWGIVDLAGHELPGVPPLPDLVVVGPMARTAEDLALALRVVAGPPALQARGWQLSLPEPPWASWKGLRVAVWPQHDDARVDDEVAGAVQDLADRMAAAGATVSDQARPALDLQDMHRIYVALVQAGSSVGVPDDVYARQREAALALEPGDTSRRAWVVRSQALEHRDWIRLDAARNEVRAAWATFFEEWDVLVTPIAPCAAFPHDARPLGERRIVVNGVEQPYFQSIFWAGLATLAYLPSTAFPVGRSREGLPLGLQVMGPAYGDLSTIAFAREVAASWGGFESPSL